MKDHEVAALVNRLRDIAVEYHAAQQLRERIAIEVRKNIGTKFAEEFISAQLAGMKQQSETYVRNVQ